MTRNPCLHLASYRLSMVLLALLTMTTKLHGQDTSAEAYRAAQLQRMRLIAERFAFDIHQEGGNVAATLLEKPFLRYNDATRQLDESTIWIWTLGERPCVLMAVEYYPTTPVGPWLFEIVSLSDGKIVASRGKEWSWQAKQPGLQPRVIPNAPVPAAQPALRLTQARQLRERFTAHEKSKLRGRIELRALANPLYRYRDEATGLVDGMIFAFANGTNPEVLLQFEATRDANSALAWHYSLAQMTGAEVYAILDGTEVFSQGTADPPAIRDSYVNGWLSDGKPAAKGVNSVQETRAK